MFLPLESLSHSSLGYVDYKTRQRISSLVGKRGKTLQKTLQKYNEMVTAMSLGRPSLRWEDVTKLDFIAEVDILRGREDIREKPWTQELSRKALRAWVKFQRAKEELLIIGIEARRIWTSIHEEEEHLMTVTGRLRPHSPELADYISMVFQKRLNANAHLRLKLTKLKLRGGCVLPTKDALGRSAREDSHLAATPATLSLDHPTQQGKRILAGHLLSTDDSQWMLIKHGQAPMIPQH